MAFKVYMNFLEYQRGSECHREDGGASGSGSEAECAGREVHNFDGRQLAGNLAVHSYERRLVASLDSGEDSCGGCCRCFSLGVCDGNFVYFLSGVNLVTGGRENDIGRVYRARSAFGGLFIVCCRRRSAL